MRHDWENLPIPLAHYGSYGFRRCRNCGAEQVRENVQDWMRIVGYRWMPPVGRCRPRVMPPKTEEILRPRGQERQMELDQDYFDQEIERLSMGFDDQGPCCSVCCQLSEGANCNEEIPPGFVRLYDDYQDCVLPVAEAQKIMAALPDFIGEEAEGRTVNFGEEEYAENGRDHFWIALCRSGAASDFERISYRHPAF